MEKDVLSTIIEIEKEIEERLDGERRKAVQWLDSAKKEIEVELAANVRELKDSLLESVDIARENAEKQASAILSEAAKQSRLLSEIGDETLKRIITEHLCRILPGSDYDCQDVKS
jgi:vacuolar-type H+-ATPase subunit H